MNNTISPAVDSYVQLYLPFFKELIDDYGFTFSISEALCGISHIHDPLNVEDVLYTIQGALCHTKEESDAFETLFCKRFLKHFDIPKSAKGQKKTPSAYVRSLMEMPDDALEVLITQMVE